MRIEKDLLGELEIDDNLYYGISTVRAKINFPITGIPIHLELVRAMILIKKAAALTNAANGDLDKEKALAITSACDEIISGRLMDNFITDSLQGGAGTSANMNVNEVIANRAIEIMGGEKGDYSLIHPIDDVNMSQSTNDVFPTAVRIAAINLLKSVTEHFASLQTALQEKEEEFSDILKVGRTELQDAVPVTLGQEFAAWAQAISRDRWRLYKAEERLRQVNIGGTAVGTGINASKKYIFNMIENLRQLSGIGLARAEYMMDPTQNCDVFVEVSGLLKTAAVNLAKMSGDIRLLSSGPKAGLSEIRLPALQAGSSIMPGKVNPVMPEMINQVAYQIMADDLAVTLAAQAGQLELNAFLPLIAKNLLEMLDLFNNALPVFIEKCIKGIQADQARCAYLLEHSYILITALNDYIGYDKSSEILKKCLEEGKSVKEILLRDRIIEPEVLERILKPENMTTLGIPGKK